MGEKLDSTAQEKESALLKVKKDAVKQISFDLKLTPTLTEQQLQSYFSAYGVLNVKKLLLSSEFEPIIFDAGIDHFQKLRDIGVDPQQVYDNFVLGIGIEFEDEKLLLVDKVVGEEDFNIKEQIENCGYKIFLFTENDGGGK